MNIAIKYMLIGCLFSIFTLTGCTTTNPYTGEEDVSKTSVGVGIGAIGGAIVGQLLGGDTGSTVAGAAVGAAIGGVSGNYMDQQDARLRAQLRGTGVQVRRVGRDVRLIMPGDITFAKDQANIKSSFYNTLNSVAKVLVEFDRTTVKVAGYASSTGGAMHNQKLSERRARSVANYLVAQGIDPNRIMVVGYGARFPIASNATREGRALNRRVEITIHQLR